MQFCHLLQVVRAEQSLRLCRECIMARAGLYYNPRAVSDIPRCRSHPAPYVPGRTIAWFGVGGRSLALAISASGIRSKRLVISPPHFLRLAASWLE
jgi:hypothetical protein